MKKNFWNIGIILWMSLSLMGCTWMEASDKKVADMTFEIVDSGSLPKEVQDMIESRKKERFYMAYHEDDASYIILGYGVQESTGYSIAVNDVYEGENGIWVDTDLFGPKKTETTEDVLTYPYVVIKTRKIDEMIRFKS